MNCDASVRYLTSEDILANSESVPSTVLKDARDAFLKQVDSESGGGLIDPLTKRRGEDESYLSGLFVGAEYPI